MNADVAVPFMSGDVVIGWLALKDEEELESFTNEDVARLSQTAARASVILENLHGIERLKEEHRLHHEATSALATERVALAELRAACDALPENDTVILWEPRGYYVWRTNQARPPAFCSTAAGALLSWYRSVQGSVTRG
jgi:putative methionine-R-sulfoxide reductase with GAF domain